MTPDSLAKAIPAPTRDLDRAEADLKAHGLALFADALDPATLIAVREATYRVAAQDRRHGRIEEAIRSDDGTQRIWNLPSRDPVFCDLVEHPAALRLAKAMLGWPLLLSNLSANITAPGSGEMMLHCDQGSYPLPWNRPLAVNIAWVVDDFTDANGATRVVPDSLGWQKPMDPATDPGIPTIPIEAKAGTMIAMDGRLWHKTGPNRTADQRRAGLFAVYTLPVFLPQENWWLSLDPAVRQFGSPTLLTLLGFRNDFYFGRVNGRPVG